MDLIWTYLYQQETYIDLLWPTLKLLEPTLFDQLYTHIELKLNKIRCTLNLLGLMFVSVWSIFTYIEPISTYYKPKLC